VIYTTTSVGFNNGSSVFVLGAAGTYTGNTLITTGNGINSPVFLKAGIVNALPVTTVLEFDGVTGGGSIRIFQYDLAGYDQTLAGLTNTVASLRSQRIRNTGSLATLTINNTVDMSFGGADLTGANTNRAQILDAIALTKSGPGTFTLGGTLQGGATEQGNTFTGATKVLAGILSLGETTSLRNSAFDTLNSVTGDATNGLRTTPATLTLGGLTGNKNFASVFTTTGGYTGLTALTLNPGTGVTHSYSADIGNGNGSMSLTKTGAGTQILASTNTYTGNTTISGGTLALGANNALPATPVSIGTATLDAATFDDTVGTLDAAGSAVINLGAGANLVFADSSGIDWTGGTLNITGTFVSGSSLKFGSSMGGLLPGQLALISVNGAGAGTYTLDSNGFLVAPGGSNNYASWANDPAKGNIPGEPATGDFDNDGITNIVEYALGQNPRVSSQPAGVLAGNVITYTKGADAIANGDVSWVIEISQTLDTGSWSPAVTQSGGDPSSTISHTFTPGTPAKNFARLKVTQP
jgi:autotransporter-associated beta strand protein